MFRKQIIAKMDAVEREHAAAAFSVAELLRRAQGNPTVLRGSVTLADLRLASRHLEDTYLVRLFAVFEEALRDIRRVVYGRMGAIAAKALIDQCASREHVRHDDIRSAHHVRKYRNSIVHGGSAEQVSLPIGRKWLCTYFGWMPKQW